MIKIAPYYARPEQERNEILMLYLDMVADVVPFLRSDVLDGFPVAIAEKHRKRTKAYIETIAGQWKRSGIETASEAMEIVRENRAFLDRLADALCENEYLLAEDISRIAKGSGHSGVHFRCKNANAA